MVGHCTFNELQVPKGSTRRTLEQDGRVMVIKINRTLTAAIIKELILIEFKWVHSYTV